VYCNRSCLWVCMFATDGRAVSEPYYSQRFFQYYCSIHVYCKNKCIFMRGHLRHASNVRIRLCVTLATSRVKTFMIFAFHCTSETGFGLVCEWVAYAIKHLEQWTRSAALGGGGVGWSLWCTVPCGWGFLGCRTGCAVLLERWFNYLLFHYSGGVMSVSCNSCADTLL